MVCDVNVFSAIGNIFLLFRFRWSNLRTNNNHYISRTLFFTSSEVAFDWRRWNHIGYDKSPPIGRHFEKVDCFWQWSRCTNFIIIFTQSLRFDVANLFRIFISTDVKVWSSFWPQTWIPACFFLFSHTNDHINCAYVNGSYYFWPVRKQAILLFSLFWLCSSSFSCVDSNRNFIHNFFTQFVRKILRIEFDSEVPSIFSRTLYLISNIKVFKFLFNFFSISLR